VRPDPSPIPSSAAVSPPVLGAQGSNLLRSETDPLPKQQLAEEVLHFAQQAAGGGLVLDMHGLAELAKQITL
jgi:hypothetical protein